MQMSNLSDRNAFVRFAAGTTMTAMGIAKYSRNPSCMRARGMMILGAMKMAEGVFKYCPTKAFLQNNMQSTVKDMLSGQNPDMEKVIQDFAKIVSEGGNKNNGTSTNSSSNSPSSTNSSASNNLVNQAVSAFASAVEGATPTNSATPSQSTHASTSPKSSSDNKKTASSSNSSHKSNTQSATNPS